MLYFLFQTIQGNYRFLYENLCFSLFLKKISFLDYKGSWGCGFLLILSFYFFGEKIKIFANSFENFKCDLRQGFDKNNLIKTEGQVEKVVLQNLKKKNLIELRRSRVIYDFHSIFDTFSHWNRGFRTAEHRLFFLIMSL